MNKLYCIYRFYTQFAFNQIADDDRGGSQQQQQQHQTNTNRQQTKHTLNISLHATSDQSAEQ